LTLATALQRFGREEEELVRLAKSLDPGAWAAIYDRHFHILYRYAYARVRCREEAEDLAAQVFLEALRGIGKYEDRGRPLLAWLYRIAHNLIVEGVRRNERARRAAATLNSGANHQPGPEGSVENMDLLDAVSQLTPEQREVIILRFFLQLTTKEVAAMLAKTEAAVVSLQVRGVAALKRRLALVEGSDAPLARQAAAR
jgi:RNA polymerase sigma-70 factor (ECF subfamily)